MPTIPRAAINYYSDQINLVSGDAQQKVSRLLEQINWAQDNIAEMRELVSDAVVQVCEAYTSASAQAAADFYDVVRVLATGESLGAIPSSGYNSQATDGAIRAFVQHIVADAAVETFSTLVLDRVDYEIKRAANISVASNAARDPLKPRYARVPTGFETCGFCIMLASRGFAYSTAEAASHAHAHCDCRVVPGFTGIEVEGYSPSDLYDQWKQMRDASRESSSGDTFPRIKGNHSVTDDLRATNPRFNDGPEWQLNCQRCVPTYEMRRRGYDVTAKPRLIDPETGKGSKTDATASAWRNIFENAEWIPCNGNGKRMTEHLMKEWGDGARAEVYVVWKKNVANGSHVFVAENVGGEVKYMCPQTNIDDYSGYFNLVAKGKTEIARIDNLEPSDLIQECCEGV